jgi:hypothetical protein
MTAGIAVLALPLAQVAVAQQVYFTPRAEVGAEYHTNRELVTDPALEDAMIEYRGLFEAVTGRRTARSQIELRPKVILQEFPDRSGIDPIELFCDLDYAFHTQRSEFEFLTRYARQDSFNAEYGDANFDPFAPQDSGAQDTGITYIGDTRQRLSVEPDYSYAISELTRIGARARYGNVNFYANDDKPVGTTGLIGYDSEWFQPYMSRQFGQQFTADIGPFISRFEADDGSNKSDNYGLAISGKYTWSQIWEVGGSAQYQYSEIEQSQATLSNQNQSNWGLEFYGVRKGEVSTLRFDVGHFIEPSSAASMIETDQLRMQYDHFLTPRLLFNGAVRIKESSRLGSLAGNTSDFARAELSLRWRMTFSWFIRVGYRYAWKDSSGGGNSADDDAVLLSIGYRGLGPSE